jgi:hypothetical protein
MAQTADPSSLGYAPTASRGRRDDKGEGSRNSVLAYECRKSLGICRQVDTHFNVLKPPEKKTPEFQVSDRWKLWSFDCYENGD